MELREGYKQTEIGIIPTEWESPTLDDIGSFFKGKGIKKDEVQSEGFPCVRYGELYTLYDNIIKETKSFISNKVSQESYKLKYGDLLFAGSGETKEEIGKSAVILRRDAYAGGDIVILRSNNEIVDFNYLGYVSNSNQVSKQKSKNGQGDAVVHIYSSGLSNVKIPLPPLYEQTAIATVLSDTDQLVQAIEKKIAKKHLIKQGAMQELLRPKEGWVERKLGEICEVFGRIGFRGYTKDDIVKPNKGAIALSPSNIKSAKLNLTKCTYISWFKYQESPEIKIYNGDILLVKTGSTFGKTAIVKGLPQKATINPQIVVLKKIKIDNYLLSYIMNHEHIQRQINDTIVGGAIPTLSQKEIESFSIKIPNDINLQTQISSILSDMDKEIEQLENQLSKYKELKQGLMQNLLTGKIRLV